MAHLQTSTQGQISDACYARGEYRYDVDGKTIMNELGVTAKVGDIIMRASNGFPLRRMGDKEPIMIDLKTGEPIKEA